MFPMIPMEIAQGLKEAGHEVYFAGGAVRDILMAKTPKDFDIATSATPEQVVQLFPFHDVKPVGKFLVVLVDGIEVTTFRKDVYYGFSDKNVQISVGTMEDDMSRRDFTVNAMFLDPFTFGVIDKVHGMADLGAKLLRFVGNPHDRITEDPNRIIRAARFSASHGLLFEEGTEKALREYAHYVRDYVEPERIRIEIMKALEIPFEADWFFRELQRLGILQYIFPSLSKTEIDGGKHHGETVFEHSMISGQKISHKFPLVRLGGFLHDVGKPLSQRINPRTGEDWFEGHDEKGVEVVKKEMEHLRFSNDEVNFVSSLVRLHMRLTKGMGPKALRRLLRDCNEARVTWKDLVRLRFGDHQGNFKKEENPLPYFKEIVKLFHDELKERPEPPSLKLLKVDGNDVMEVTGLKPGPMVGKILKSLFEKFLEDPSINEKEKLVELIKEQV